jgi:RHS repeat-associated protein
VLILGGVGADGDLVDLVERFDPITLAFDSLTTNHVNPRAGHSATVLTDGRLLIAGGMSVGGRLLDHAEIWDPDTNSSVFAGSLLAPRVGHTATLLPSGSVLLSAGIGVDGRPVESNELYDSDAGLFTAAATQPSSDAGAASVVASIPEDGAAAVSEDTKIAARFSVPMKVETLTANHVLLTGPTGVIPAAVVAAEGGMLVFLVPGEPLMAGRMYTVTLRGVTDQAGAPVPLTEIRFTTQGDGGGERDAAGHRSGPSATPLPRVQADEPDVTDDDWLRDALRSGKWKTGYPPSPWQSLAPLQAPEGITALAGQALTLKGDPLADVTIQLGAARALTDANGQFLLQGIASGPQEVLIDGRSANRPGRTYGVFEVGVKLAPGRTTVLPYTIWMPEIDTAHAVAIPSPTTTEVVVTTPKIHGLEVRIPPGAVIRDVDGQVVTAVSITAVPVDRPPFPLARNVDVPVYFTIQPGGAYSSKGIRVVYPNTGQHLPGERRNFWRYEPSEVGWSIYGLATVTPDAKQLVPDPGVAFYEFTGVMTNGGTPYEDRPTGDSSGGDPVNLSTGLFVLRNTDLFLPDVIPIALTRTYMHRDHTVRPFGIGASHPYAMFLWSANAFQEANLVQADGSEIHYIRVSPGVGFEDAIFETTETPTEFYKSRMVWNGNGWDLTLKNGTVYVFGENAPLQEIRDRNGNRLLISYSNGQAGNIMRITSPNNRWIAFTYDASNRITQVTDNIGRTVSYAYNTSGELVSVTDPGGGVTQYTYEADNSHRMIALQDARGNVVLENYYDQNRVARQEVGGEDNLYRFSYTVNGNGIIIQTDVIDPRGTIRRVSFNSEGFATSDIQALGLPEQQSITYTRELGTNIILNQTDALGRVTSFTYDSSGNVVAITRAAGTADAATTSFTYEPTFNLLASITDPLNHTTTYNYDLQGNLRTVTGPLNEQQTTFDYNAAGQQTLITDPLGKTIQYAYESGDLVSITDHLGNRTTRYLDGAGRVTIVTDPKGHQTRYEYDALDRLTRVIDPLGGTTTFNYDATGNLLSVTDARGNTNSYSYDILGHVVSRTDALLHTDAYIYDTVGNLTTFTSRKNDTATLSYDALNRRASVTYADLSNISYTWDQANRLTQVVDSVAGTITRAYDNLDRLTSETTTQGSVSYTYDGADRRTSMTVEGEPTVTYTYDAGNRLMQVVRASSTVGFGYDAASRRTSLTLPNGITLTYDYDAVGRATGIAYTQGQTTLGNLAYEYDAAGNRIQTAGSFARTGLPQVLTSAVYNAGNQQTSYGGLALTYDLNGNLSNDGIRTYVWDARNRLSGITSGDVAAAFTYDALGRRVSKTVNGVTTAFLYDGMNPVKEVSGTTVKLLTGFGLDEYFSRTGSTTTFVPLADVLGSIIAITDSLGSVQSEYNYEPFGAASVIGPDLGNPFQFTGRENDATGLYYYRTRYYSPTAQRFVSEDPLFTRDPVFMASAACRASVPSTPQLKELAALAGQNAYAYVTNNPLRYTDPLGLDPQEISDRSTTLKDCLNACAKGITAIEAFCRSLPDPRARAICWANRWSKPLCQGFCYLLWGT